MKVLFITRKYPPQIGGMENLSCNLIQHFPSPKRTIILNKKQKHLVWFIPYAIFKSLLLAPKVDLIHIGDPLLSIVGFLIGKLYGKPVVTTVHGLDITYPKPLYQRYLNIFMKLDKYICISKHTEKLLKSRKGKFNTSVIPVGINPTFPEQTKEDILEKDFGIRRSQRQAILLTVGRLVKRKGVYWFVNNVIDRINKNAIYLVVGEGPEKERIERLIKAQKLGKRVFLLGKVEDDALLSLYNLADIFIAPNIKVEGDAEGFGLVLLEASSQGKPVVASDLEGIKEAIKDGYNGFLVQPEQPAGFAQRINWLISHPKKAREFGLRAKVYTCKHYHWAKIAKRYYREFEIVLGKKSILKRPIVTLTFDDCYHDTLKSVLPLLEKYQMPGTFNVIAKRINDDLQKIKLASLRDLRYAQSLGMEIASHSLTHTNLSTGFPAVKYLKSFLGSQSKWQSLNKAFGRVNLIPHQKKTFSDKLLSEEVASSKKLLRQYGFKIRSFTYPGGVNNKTIKNFVKKIYDSARTMDPGLNKLPPNDLYSLKTFAWNQWTRAEAANKQVNNVIKNGGWLVETFHLIGKSNLSNYEYFTHVNEFEKHLKYLKDKKVQIATQADVIKYVRKQKLNEKEN